MSSIRRRLESIKRHAAMTPEGRHIGMSNYWTEAESFEAIGIVTDEILRELDKSRLAPGSRWALIDDQVPDA